MQKKYIFITCIIGIALFGFLFSLNLFFNFRSFTVEFSLMNQNGKDAKNDTVSFKTAIKIEGDDEFLKKAENAINIVERHAPEYIKILNDNITRLIPFGFSTIQPKNGEIFVGSKLLSKDAVSYALTLIHEACQIDLCKKNNFACQEKGKKEIEYCLLMEKDAFQKIRKEIEVTKELENYYSDENIQKLVDGRWWTIPLREETVSQ